MACKSAGGVSITARRNRRSSDERETGRLEAFSDGVFAIAVTLLVLDLRIPVANGDRDLAAALGREWPTYLAYVTSFVTILVMWLNHHAIFRVVRRADHWLYVLNGLLLLVISVIPFPTSLMAEYLQHAGGRAAAVVFASTYLLLALAYNAVWHYLLRHPDLHDPRLNPEWVRSLTRRYQFGPPLYILGIIIAVVNVYAFLVFVAVQALVFLLPLGVDHFLPDDAEV